MTDFETKDENRNFINKFNIDKYGFYDVVPFDDCKIGFSVKRKLKEKSSPLFFSLIISFFFFVWLIKFKLIDQESNDSNRLYDF